MHIVSFKNVGAPSTPQDIKRLRRENMDYCRKMGQPVVFRHMFNRDDVEDETAKVCPACYDSAYDQTRNDCSVCFGFGFVSIEDSEDEDLYIDRSGNIVEGDQDSTGIRAPRWGGFGQPYLTWMVEPDVAVDVFRLNEQGVMIRTYDAQGQAPWFPKMGDNDLCINVRLAPDDYAIIETEDRFQLKRVQQVTIRGFGRRSGRHASGASGQPFLTSQTFEMSRSPDNQTLYDIPIEGN